MDEQKISRINELYHKSKQEGLTKAEKEEQALLRAEYIAAVRTLSQISIVEPDGSITDLSKRNEN